MFQNSTLGTVVGFHGNFDQGYNKLHVQLRQIAIVTINLWEPWNKEQSDSVETIANVTMETSATVASQVGCCSGTCD